MICTGCVVLQMSVEPAKLMFGRHNAAFGLRALKVGGILLLSKVSLVRGIDVMVSFL